MHAAELFSLVTNWLLSNVWTLVSAFVITIIGLIAAKLVSDLIRKRLSRKHGFDQTVAPFLVEISRYAILIFTIMLALAQLGIETTTMLAVLGAVAVAIALGMRDILTNVASGLMIVILRPMSIGDYIQTTGAAGTITEIGLFATRMVSADGQYMFVPNSQIWKSAITNYNRQPRRRFDFKIGISYDADIGKARRALLKIAKADKRILTDPAAVVHVDELSDSAVTMLLRVWVPTNDYWDVRYAVIEKVKFAFDKDGIEIYRNRLNVSLLSNATTPLQQTV